MQPITNLNAYLENYERNWWHNWFKKITKEIAETQRKHLQLKNKRNRFAVRHEQRKNMLMLLTAQQKTMTEISEIIGLTKQRVHQLFQMYEIDPYIRPAQPYDYKKRELGTYEFAHKKSGIHTQQLIDWYKSGHSVAEIRRMIGYRLSVNAIYKRFERAGLTLDHLKRDRPARQKITNEQLINAYNEGLTQQKIADRYNMRLNSIQNRIARLRKRGEID